MSLASWFTICLYFSSLEHYVSVISRFQCMHIYRVNLYISLPFSLSLIFLIISSLSLLLLSTLFSLSSLSSSTLFLSFSFLPLLSLSFCSLICHYTNNLNSVNSIDWTPLVKQWLAIYPDISLLIEFNLPRVLYFHIFVPDFWII